MSFMQPQWERAEVYIVDTQHGTELVPVDVSGRVSSVDQLRDYLSADPLDDEELPDPVVKWISRLSAPGYMDCTDWTYHDTERDALEHLLEFYGSGSDDPDQREDWESELEERIAELSTPAGWDSIDTSTED